ncbi:exodeoxyribonuclease V subunit alpha [Acinetobacter rathckeae]|uniref:exodeoxyribonuclease V subunit alpha n=1 Tax=Acinetobacter rathckeae TaxID=2605272 RepID=UPI002B1BD34E|nr:exodeoxyribonuclease V subunit alpha [Acinetobacter rathckeae]
MNNLEKQEMQLEPWVIQWSDYLTNAADFTNADDKIAAQNLIHAVLFAASQGNSCLELTALHAKRLRSLLSFADKSQISPFVFCNNRLYLYRYYALERRLAQQVHRLSQQSVVVVDSAAYDGLLKDPHQKQALEWVASSGLSLITGGPGTGKTYTLARIIAALNHSVAHLRIAMAAPTGKAAQRMQEALKNAFADLEPRLMTPELQLLQPVTLHRLLKIGQKGRAQFNQAQPLPYDVVVVDEASMLDLNLATQLFEAIATGTRLILLGDANQLSSVDVGTVLSDLQRSQLLESHVVELKYSRRFSGDAQIGRMAQFIQQQKQPQNASHDVVIAFEQQIVQPSELRPIQISMLEKDLIQLQYIEDTAKVTSAKTHEHLQSLWYGFQGYAVALEQYFQSETYAENTDLSPEQEAVLKAFDDYRILTAMRYGTFGVTQLNHDMQAKLLEHLVAYTQASGDWYVGRPVMMTENNYQLGLSNGDVGICFKHRQDPTQFEVYFPSLAKWVLATRLPKHIQTAFAMTIHKSQGSEFTHTAVVLEPAAEQLLSQELLYTAITRAKKVVTLLVDQTAFARALSHQTTRHSGLADFIDT